MDLQQAISRLMARPTLGRNTRILPEQSLTILVADWLRLQTRTGKLNAIWVHVPNEGKRSMVVAMILKAMGLIHGAADLLFMSDKGSWAIELKVDGKQTENQMAFETWCKAHGVPYAVCTSLECVQEKLKNWGLI